MNGQWPAHKKGHCQNHLRERVALHTAGVKDSSRWSQLAKTTGQGARGRSHPGGVSPFVWHPAGARTRIHPVTGGLRFATTSGYSLSTFRVATPGRDSNAWRVDITRALLVPLSAL